MAHTITFARVTDEDKESIGIRGYDLSRMAQASYHTPLSFIIKTSLFEGFLDATGIKGKVANIYERHPQTIDGCARAYKEIRELFKPVKFSPSLQEELLEAYQSLAIKDTSDLVNGGEEPLVMLIPSFTYGLRPERLVGVQRCIKGAEHFFEAIKECWLSIYLPELVMERQYYKQENYSMAIIVQQQLMGDGSAEATYKHEEELPIHVQSYHGLLDTQGEVLKDEYAIRADHLSIVRSNSNRQPFKLVPGEASSVITQIGMGEAGERPALTDKQALEVARITKRAHVTLQTDLQAFFSVKAEASTLLFLLRIGGGSLTQVIEEAEAPEPVVENGDGYIKMEDVPEETITVIEEETEESYEAEPTKISASDLIAETMALLHEAIKQRYQELNNDHVASFVAMVESLHEAGELPVHRDDVNLLVKGHLLVDDEPHDHLIGVAWRLNQYLR